MIENSKSAAERELYYKWCNQVCKGDHISDSKLNKAKFEEFFLMLTGGEQLKQLN